MKLDLSITTLIRSALGALICVLLFHNSGKAADGPPPGIIGPDAVQSGVSANYEITPSVLVAAPVWEISSGTATINSTWQVGSTYYATVTWTTSGTLHFFDEVEGTSATKNVSIIGSPTPLNGSRCGTGTVALSATTGSGGTTVRWYTGSTGGTPLTTGLTYTTPSLSSTTTYYIETWNATWSIASSPRIAITATVNPVPAAVTSVTGGFSCGASAITLSATPSSGNTATWFVSNSSSDVIYSGSNFTTPVLSEPTTYFVASYNSTTQCYSTRTPVLANANQKPPLVAIWSEDVSYGPGSVTFKSHSYTLTLGDPLYAEPINESPIDTTKYDLVWYATQSDAAADLSRLHVGKNYTTALLTEETWFYVRLREKTTGCWSDISTGLAKIIPLISNASIKTDVVRVAGKKNEAVLTTLTDSEKTTTYTYLDGIGRAQQQVVLRGSPGGKDFVSPVEYDQWGRISKSYLPYADTVATTGAFNSAYKLEQQRFYLKANDKIADDSIAYAITKYDDSPLGRVLEQGGVGKAWQPGTSHSEKIEYSFNTSTDNVRRFNPNGTSSGFYAAKTLRKIKGIDADGNYIITFTDGAGQTILVRQLLEETVEGTYTSFLETYTIYNDIGLVNYIISPKGVAELIAGSWSFTQTIKDSYCNQFKYDSKGRVIEKKVPGQAWQYIVYDPLGRIVLTQDGMLRPDSKWMFLKYDYQGHAIMSGIHTNTTYTTRATMQAYVNGIYVSGHATYGASTSYEQQGATLEGYTNVSFPKDNIEVLAVGYFDDYDFDNNGSADVSYVTAGITGEHTPAAYAFNRVTGSKRKILGTSTWLKTYTLYDELGQTIQIQTTNPLNTGSLDRLTNAYADDGRILYSKRYHNAGTGLTNDILTKYEYSIRGDVWKISQDNGGTGTSYQLLAQYEYNELGQLVDKKLHNTGGSNFMQSVDYRYTIKGQLKSINNSELSSNSSNDETNDFFGMELLYDNSESGLTTTPKFDGNISAIKWKGAGASSGSSGQRSYAYSYDKTGRLTAAGYSVKGSAWDKEVGALNESMTYDLNGNIKTLQRAQRKHQLTGLIAYYTNETIDNLTYAYTSNNKNSLEKVTDGAGISAAMGFDNGSSGAGNDYTYDGNGNLLTDSNKGISGIVYNFLGKPSQVNFSDGRKIDYVYDAIGNKLTQRLYQGATLLTTTHYANGFVYEAVGGGSLALTFFRSPEGRVVKNGSNLEFQYAIADHQGNTRVVFTSATPSASVTTVNFEQATNSNVLNYSRTNFELFDHTDVSGSTYTYSQKLTGASGSQVGVAKTLQVYPGDKVKIEAYAKYYNPQATSSNLSGFAAALTSAFGVSSGSSGEALKAYNTLNNYGGIIAGGAGGGNGSYPKLFVNILLFDKDHNFLDAAWEQIDGGEQVGATPKAAHDYMSREVTVKEAGFAYVYVSNENPTLVEFYVDDITITHSPTSIIQYNEYYPFGLQNSASWTRQNTTENSFLYNEGNELNKSAAWYETPFRIYDPILGRFAQIDPLATAESWSSPYAYGRNNPVRFNDPTGLFTEDDFDKLAKFIDKALDGHGGSWSSSSDKPEYYSSDLEGFVAGLEFLGLYNFLDFSGGGGSFSGGGSSGTSGPATTVNQAVDRYADATGIRVLRELVIIHDGKGRFGGEAYDNPNWLQERIDESYGYNSPSNGYDPRYGADPTNTKFPYNQSGLVLTIASTATTIPASQYRYFLNNFSKSAVNISRTSSKLLGGAGFILTAAQFAYKAWDSNQSLNFNDYADFTVGVGTFVAGFFVATPLGIAVVAGVSIGYGIYTLWRDRGN